MLLSICLNNLEVYCLKISLTAVTSCLSVCLFWDDWENARLLKQLNFRSEQRVVWHGWWIIAQNFVQQLKCAKGACAMLAGTCESTSCGMLAGLPNQLGIGRLSRHLWAMLSICLNNLEVYCRVKAPTCSPNFQHMQDFRAVSFIKVKSLRRRSKKSVWSLITRALL